MMMVMMMLAQRVEGCLKVATNNKLFVETLFFFFPFCGALVSQENLGLDSKKFFLEAFA